MVMCHSYIMVYQTVPLFPMAWLRWCDEHDLQMRRARLGESHQSLWGWRDRFAEFQFLTCFRDGRGWVKLSMAMTWQNRLIGGTYYINKVYVREYLHKIWPYMVQYLHFRILKFPLKLPMKLTYHWGKNHAWTSYDLGYPVSRLLTHHIGALKIEPLNLVSDKQTSSHRRLSHIPAKLVHRWAHQGVQIYDHLGCLKHS